MIKEFFDSISLGEGDFIDGLSLMACGTIYGYVLGIDKVSTFMWITVILGIMVLKMFVKSWIYTKEIMEKI